MAGLGDVDVDGVENIDLSTIVESHYDYGDEISLILRTVKFNDHNGKRFDSPIH